ncbi:MAG: Nif3-like dinuclear metal center hexameric protein [Gemmatimonadaceae bacterium]
MPLLGEIAARLDAELRTSEIADYPTAVNGIQLENRGEIRGVAVAVDCSRRTIEGAISAGANLLVVHHGLLWGGVQPIRGALYDRLYRLLASDIAVYSSHLPLDAHPELGNNVLLAKELGLVPDGGFARSHGAEIGVRGGSSLATAEIVARADAFARRHGGAARASDFAADRPTHRWGICTGGGASADTLREAVALGLDTLIVGEGPHWTAVDAPEIGLVIIYAGHYATETLGVQALGRLIEREFSLPWRFIEAPTGL